MPAGRRLARLMRSFLGLPHWVKAWMTLLIGVNMAAFWLLDTEIGFWTALALFVVLALNMPAMIVQAGMRRLLSLPDFVWLPLVIFILYRLFGPAPVAADSVEFRYGLLIVIVNGISLGFDVYESRRWLRGEREVLGLAKQASKG